jgi:hypothetical protein
MSADDIPTSRFGQKHFTDPTYAVSNLSSLFAVCAFALDGLSDYSEAIQDRGLQDVKHTLEFCAELAVHVANDVEQAIAEANTKGGAE